MVRFQSLTAKGGRMKPQGFKHEDDWQAHPHGCECDKCYAKFTENIVKAFTPVSAKETKEASK
jgi:hypothetical protein